MKSGVEAISEGKRHNSSAELHPFAMTLGTRGLHLLGSPRTSSQPKILIFAYHTAVDKVEGNDALIEPGPCE